MSVVEKKVDGVNFFIDCCFDNDQGKFIYAKDDEGNSYLTSLPNIDCYTHKYAVNFSEKKYGKRLTVLCEGLFWCYGITFSISEMIGDTDLGQIIKTFQEVLPHKYVRVTM